MKFFSDHDGSNKENAIIIKGAKKSQEGVKAEYRYLKENLGTAGIDWKLISQELYRIGDKSYDVLLLSDNKGKEFTLWFEISNFFGK